MVLVSCLMVTLPVPERRSMLRQSIEAYLRQSHRDRELIVIVDQGAAADRRALVEGIAALGRADIRVDLPAAPLTLGALRNRSVAQAAGEVVCQWDDDDLHHPDRIAAQLAALHASGAQAAILRDVLLFRARERTLRWTNWARTPAGGHPATLIGLRSAVLRYPESGPEAVRGEDLHVLAPLIAAGALHRHADAPHLYVYVSHGANSCGVEHHDSLAERLTISQALLRRREAMVRAGVAPLDFGGSPVSVEGPAGHAFSL